MAPRINKRLNLVIPLEGDNGMIYVHSTPISRDVFEQYAMPISKTTSILYDSSTPAFTGPRVAALALKKVAESMREWDGPDGVGNGLMNEIRRLSNVVVPGERGWETIPFHDAAANGTLSEDDVAEAEGQIVFFTCVSWMHQKKEVPSLLAGVNEVWDSQNTPLNSTEWANSLPISTAEESSGETATQSSIPH